MSKQAKVLSKKMLLQNYYFAFFVFFYFVPFYQNLKMKDKRCLIVFTFALVFYRIERLGIYDFYIKLFKLQI